MKVSAAFVVSLGLLLVGIGICIRVGRRRPPGTPVTWGEAFVAATFVFGLMLLGYGVVPNEWLLWADNQLIWRSDKLLLAVSSEGVKFGDAAATFGGTGRIVVTYQALRDIIAAGIYVVMLGAQIALWAMWQKRGQAKRAEVATSDFGRPLVRRV
jgi:hypothetical protein